MVSIKAKTDTFKMSSENSVLSPELNKRWEQSEIGLRAVHKKIEVNKFTQLKPTKAVKSTKNTALTSIWLRTQNSLKALWANTTDTKNKLEKLAG